MQHQGSSYRCGRVFGPQAERIRYVAASLRLAFVNIRKQAVRLDDVTFRVAKRKIAYVDPSIYAIGMSDSVRNVIEVPDRKKS